MVLESENILVKQKEILKDLLKVRKKSNLVKLNLNSALDTCGYFGKESEVENKNEIIKGLLKAKRLNNKQRTKIKKQKFLAIISNAKLRYILCDSVSKIAWTYKNQVQKEVYENLFFELVKIRNLVKKCYDYYFWKYSKLNRRKKVKLETIKKVKNEVNECLAFFGKINNLIEYTLTKYKFNEENLSNRKDYRKRLNQYLISEFSIQE